MLPIPTKAAVALFIGAVAMLFIGIAAASIAAATLATGIFVGMAATLAATLPLGRRVRRQRLEFAWWLGHGDPAVGSGTVVPGSPFEVRCYVRHRGDAFLSLSTVRPLMPGDAKLLDASPDALALVPQARTEFGFRLIAPAVGRVVLHGLAVTLRGPLGLFQVPLYFPNPLSIKVLPRITTRLRGAQRVVTGQPIERSGRTVLRRRGGGTELYELREHQPGDPFKAIAWKASARAAKLMVREVEREVQQTRWVILDISGTMRGGEPGRRKLDYTIEAAAAEAHLALGEGDRFGLITVDGRIVSHVAPKDGTPHMIRVYDALLASTEVVDQDLTDIDDDEVTALVGRYLRNQDGLDFGRRGRSNDWDVPAMLRHIGQALGDSKERSSAPQPSPTSLPRRFCRARGIPLPYRPDPRDGSKAPGLAHALQQAGGRSKAPASILILTDFDGIGDPADLTSAVRLARAHGHQVAFVAPDAQSFAPGPRNALEEDLHRVFGRAEARRLREARVVFGRLGVPVLTATRGQPAALALVRARLATRAA